MVVNVACLRGPAEVMEGEEREMGSQAKKAESKTTLLELSKLLPRHEHRWNEIK